MKKTQWDLLNFLDLRIGDTLSIGDGDYDGYMVIYDKTIDCIYLFNCGHIMPLTTLVGVGFKIISRKRTYEDKWVEIKELRIEVIKRICDPVMVSTSDLFFITDRMLRIMDMEEQATHLNNERSKLHSIDNRNEGD